MARGQPGRFADSSMQKTERVKDMERTGKFNGLELRFFDVVRWPTGPHRWSGRIASQTAGASRAVSGHETLAIEMRFDDACKNGHETFAITGTLRDRRVKRDGGVVAAGCLHDDVARVFPELAHLIPWHMTSTDGPMHYVANAVYLAGDRDHSGRRKGEVSCSEMRLTFGANPIEADIPESFAKFLESCRGMHDRPFDFEIIEVPHRDHGKPGAYPFRPKFTFGGYGTSWADCPFDTYREAERFLYAMQECSPRFQTVPVAWSDGKARELDAAREAAVWPDATDAELSVEPDELRAKLRARLPALLAKFKADMLSVGFIYPEGI